MKIATTRSLIACLLLIVAADLRAADNKLPDRAAAALWTACNGFHQEVSTAGGYVYQYSADLKAEEGELKTDGTTVWVEPPGTPAVGQALLEVYVLTRDKRYLRLAQDAAECLRRGQLESGGWASQIEFGERARARYAYRVEEAKGRRNSTTLDDDKTQSALRFLMQLDAVLQFKDEKVHECVTYGLQKLLAAQYPNGAFPQQFTGPPEADKHPVRKAKYPESWSRKFPKLKYTGYYTLNDNTQADVVEVLFMAHALYGDDKYQQAAMRAGDFLLLAQMPAPQPGWAQQYDPDMQPAWARKFEPPAITGGESQGVMRLLLDLYERTGQRKYLDAVGRALLYYKTCLLEDGRLARFYELKTNKPLYFTQDYELVYTDNDLPTHYGFKVGSKLDRIERELERLRKDDVDAQRASAQHAQDARRWSQAMQQDPQAAAKTLRVRAPANAEISRLIESLDDRGLWVESGSLRRTPDVRKVIKSQTFIRNVVQLARYVASKQK